MTALAASAPPANTEGIRVIRKQPVFWKVNMNATSSLSQATRQTVISRTGVPVNPTAENPAMNLVIDSLDEFSGTYFSCGSTNADYIIGTRPSTANN
jgi:hypothetical protein